MPWHGRGGRKPKAEKACIRNALLARKNANEVADAAGDGREGEKEGRFEMD